MKLSDWSYRIVLCVVPLLASGCSSLGTYISGDETWHPPQELAQEIKRNKPLADLIQAAFAGVGEAGIVDHHVHLVGLASHPENFLAAGSEDRFSCSEAIAKRLNQEWIYLNKRRFAGWGLFEHVQTDVFMRSAGIRPDVREQVRDNQTLSRANEEVVNRLYQLVKHFRADAPDGGQRPGRFMLLAMDAYYEQDGRINWEKTDMVIPNRYLVALTACMNQQAMRDGLGSPFMPVISIHPYRKDAIQVLDEYHRDHGVQHVKWLPNSMNIDPRSEKSRQFYRALVSRGMTLITHSGREIAILAEEENQRFGNPLLFDLALQEGVDLIMAHSGYRGSYPTAEGSISSSKAFQQMLKRYPNLTGGLSGTLIFWSRERYAVDALLDKEREERCYQPHAAYPEIDVVMAKEDCQLIRNLEWILEYVNRPDEAGSGPAWRRFVNGSDYPLPAVEFLNPTKTLFRYGFITETEEQLLNKLYRYNPLLFDFVLKRTIRHPRHADYKLPTALFTQMH